MPIRIHKDEVGKISIVRCPGGKRWPGDIAGCGSSNVTGLDEEGLYDCCDCGICFHYPEFSSAHYRDVFEKIIAVKGYGTESGTGYPMRDSDW